MRRLLLLLGFAVVSACSSNQQTLFERQRLDVMSRYAEEFACAQPDAAGTPDGYRVEGCGQVAFYHCEMRMVEVGTGFVGPCAGARTFCPPSSLQTVASCVLEHSRAMTALEEADFQARQQARYAQAAAEQRELEQVRAAKSTPVDPAKRAAGFAEARKLLAGHEAELKARGNVKADDFRIELTNVPQDASHVLFRFSTDRTLSAAPCKPTIVRDSQVLAAETIAQHSAHEAEFLVAAEGLQALDKSEEFRGVICGVDFALDERARRELASSAAN